MSESCRAEIPVYPWRTLKMHGAQNTRPGKSFFTLEKIFIASSIACYVLPFVASWAVDISLNQEIVLFFGTQMLLFLSLMLYGSVKGLLSKKSTRMQKSKRRAQSQPLDITL